MLLTFFNAFLKKLLQVDLRFLSKIEKKPQIIKFNLKTTESTVKEKQFKLAFKLKEYNRFFKTRNFRVTEERKNYVIIGKRSG